MSSRVMSLLDDVIRYVRVNRTWMMLEGESQVNDARHSVGPCVNVVFSP